MARTSQAAPSETARNVAAHLAEARRRAIVEAVDVLQPGCGAGHLFLEGKITAQIGEAAEIGVLFVFRWLIGIPPKPDRTGCISEFDAGQRIDGKTRPENDEIGLERRSITETQIDAIGHRADAFDRFAEMKEGVRMTADPQRRAAR